MGTYYHNLSKCIGACRPRSVENDDVIALATPTKHEVAELALLAATAEPAFRNVAADVGSVGVEIRVN